jgi:creatinine amidohydrolase/Fe(II)-dependent formamide hydrolase-like protein
MPSVNYGSAGANHIGGMPVHPGTYGIRQSTLRSLIADIGGQIAQNRFKWVFVMNGHAPPTHSIAVNEACDFVSDVFGATMLNVSGLFKADSLIQAQGPRLAARHFSPAQLASFGLDPHAGVGETSGLLALRPDLVRPGYRTLPSNRARTFEEMRDIAKRPGWLGYFSSPSMATAAYGRDVETWWVQGLTDLVLQALRGENLRNRPRYPGDLAGDPRLSLVDEVIAHERDFERKLEDWLSRRSKQ